MLQLAGRPRRRTGPHPVEPVRFGPAGPAPARPRRLDDLPGRAGRPVRHRLGPARLRPPKRGHHPGGGEPRPGPRPNPSDRRSAVQPGRAGRERKPDPPRGPGRPAAGHPAALRYRDLRSEGCRGQRSPPLRNLTLGRRQRGCPPPVARSATARSTVLHRHGPGVPGPGGGHRAVHRHGRHGAGHGPDPPGPGRAHDQLLRPLLRDGARGGLCRPLPPPGGHHGARRGGGRERLADPTGRGSGAGRRAVPPPSVRHLPAAGPVPARERSPGLLHRAGRLVDRASAAGARTRRHLSGDRRRPGHGHPVRAQCRPEPAVVLLGPAGRPARGRGATAEAVARLRHRYRRSAAGRPRNGPSPATTPPSTPGPSPPATSPAPSTPAIPCWGRIR